ncbi:uncharacterized protein LOC106760510 [Vigna radiata var. radiata]|uniref:Uncharacterized protein LOC106760510 n=1 Tax=Vigna radiata var. radiata TaxID=3916 RepID=A0A1S3U080_VIGRR|nr:uncharacterized protein LOC106760510 [Vigna radiata var. radiata]
MASNCANRSNPYHQCTQACSQSTNQTKITTHTSKNKINSGYGRSVTDGQLGKKVDKQKRIYSACPKASNPYHECDDNCYKRLSDSGAPPPLKLDRKSKLGSKPEPPVLDTVPASKVGAIYLSEKKKVLREKNEHVPSEPISGQKQDPVVKPSYLKDQPRDHVANSMTTTHDEKKTSRKVVPVTHHVDHTEELGLNISAGGSVGSTFSGIPRGNEANLNDEAETESVSSEPRLQVGRYKVKESFVSILQSIFDRYGDIGASCHLESVVMRSYYVECVCFVVQELHSSSLIQLSSSKVKELLAILKDVESAELDIAWLRSALDELAENIELVNKQQVVEAEKDYSGHEVETIKEELRQELETLAQKEQEVADIKARIPEIRGRLRELELKSEELNKSMLSIKSNVDNLAIKSLVDELLC